MKVTGKLIAITICLVLLLSVALILYEVKTNNR